MIVICSTNQNVILRWHGILREHYELTITRSAGELQTQLMETPDVAILHDMLFTSDGDCQAAALIRKYDNIKFLVLSDIPDEKTAFKLLHSGAFGYSNTYISPKLLRDAVNQIIRGDVWMGKRLTRYLSECLLEDINNEETEDTAIEAEDHLTKLTSREKEVARRIAHGCSNKCVANKLNITERTVKAHLSSIFMKTGIKDRVHLALILNAHKYN